VLDLQAHGFSVHAGMLKLELHAAEQAVTELRDRMAFTAHRRPDRQPCPVIDR